MIYHMISKEVWMAAREHRLYEPPSLETDRFIHCSTEEQVGGVANTFYSGRTDLLVLGIQEDQVDAEIVYEDLYEMNQLYPHIYGGLNLNAVQKVYRLEPDEEGVFTFQASTELEYRG
ncbi:hypothetical protein PAEVO_30450 [Paenibacillus sp. GM2FR]|jgi:uncharacterized protein (DUF952 family)|uniref:DUF952 domain-containing protein n=1 Tax=Paenibacillus TaxID=44249 RepID=UPI000C2753F9|nr:MULTISPECIES: DUF952 domain-containing protein [Paenibacillus]MEC0257372.1 DUF952 domain-containing protein [Paenibacillus lautus]MEC0308188.1 DUF952 domain-containing protein [Paenibacillus lautus]PJN56322.1 hypothetical protein PAEVO_30450 [Paenibacillus sp. GM2FR]